MTRVTAGTVAWLTLSLLASAVAQSTAERAADLVRQSLSTFARGEDADLSEKKIALYSRALALAEEAVRLNPESADAHYATFISRGRLAVVEGVGANLIHAAKFKKSLQRALTLDPNHVGALIGRASLNRELPGWLGGDLKKSEADFKRALALDPRSIDARLGLASTYIKARRLTDAAKLLNDTPMRVDVTTRRQRREAQSLLQMVGADTAGCSDGCRF